MTLGALRTLSARVGADPLLVQAAGGNTSLKDDDVMWIKASGTWLRDATARDIFVPIDDAALRLALERGDAAADACLPFVRADLNASGLRPSIETSVHALMPQRVVVHVHCVHTIAWAIRADAEVHLAARLDGESWAFIPYARPGLPLARNIAARLRTDVNVLVLANHGLVVAADTVADAEQLLDRVVARLTCAPRPLVPPDHAALAHLCDGTPYRPAYDDETHALATDGMALEIGGERAFYPDHVVFLGTRIETSLDSAAPIVALPGAGVLVRHDAKPAAEAMARCLADVMRRTPPDAPLVALTDHDVDRLVNWDAEKYRQTMPDA